FQGTLVVSQTAEVHRQIEYLLNALRESRGGQLKNAASAPIWAEEPHQAAAIARFDSKAHLRADFDFDQLPLAQVAVFIGRSYNLGVVFDWRSLKDAAIGEDTALSCHVHNVSLAATSDWLLRDIDATFMLKDELVVITI